MSLGSRLMERYLDLVERNARAIVFVLVAITAGFAYYLGAVIADTNPYLLKEDHPARKTILDLQKEFSGTYDSVMIAFTDPDGVFNRETLNAVFAISQIGRASWPTIRTATPCARCSVAIPVTRRPRRWRTRC